MRRVLQKGYLSITKFLYNSIPRWREQTIGGYTLGGRDPILWKFEVYRPGQGTEPGPDQAPRGGFRSKNVFAWKWPKEKK